MPERAAPDWACADWETAKTTAKAIACQGRRGNFTFMKPLLDEAATLKAVAVDVKEQIKRVHNKILSKDFYTGCGKEDCHWCKFVKTNKLAVALHELQEEEPESQRNLLRIV